MATSYWDRIAEQRTSRRRVLQAGAAGSVAGAVWLAGCGGNGSTTKSPVAPTATRSPSTTGPDILNEKNPPVAGGRQQIAYGANFDTFDPHLGIAFSTALFPRIYNTLVSQSATRPEFLVFDLAESYENPDPTTWNFKIRPGVRIAPNALGVPERDLSAEDAVATFDRIKAEPRASNGAFMKANVASNVANGDIFELKMNQPYAWLLNRIGNHLNTIPPRELITSDANLEVIKQRGAGGGPFVLISSTEGEGAKLDRNPSYYGRAARNDNAPIPYLAGLDTRIILDPAALRAAFLSNQIHSYSPQTKKEADEFVSNASYYLSKDPTFSFISLTMNPERPPFDDARVRRAFSRAINRQQYIDLVSEGDAQADGIVHWPTGSYSLPPEELDKLQPFDVADARKLVEAVGGIKVKMIVPTVGTDKYLPIFLEQMKNANIEIEQDVQDFTTWLENYRTLNYALSLSLNQVYETPETPLDFHSKGGPLTDRSYAIGLGDPEIDAAISKTKETLDLEERIAAVHDAQRLIYSKDPTFLPFASGYTYNAISKKLHNVPGGVGITGLFLNTAWLEA